MKFNYLPKDTYFHSFLKIQLLRSAWQHLLPTEKPARRVIL